MRCSFSDIYIFSIQNEIKIFVVIRTTLCNQNGRNRRTYRTTTKKTRTRKIVSASFSNKSHWRSRINYSKHQWASTIENSNIHLVRVVFFLRLNFNCCVNITKEMRENNSSPKILIDYGVCCLSHILSESLYLAFASHFCSLYYAILHEHTRKKSLVYICLVCIGYWIQWFGINEHSHLKHSGLKSYLFSFFYFCHSISCAFFNLFSLILYIL